MNDNNRAFDRLFRWASIRTWFILPSLFQMLLTGCLFLFFMLQIFRGSSNLIIDSIQQEILYQVESRITHRLELAMQLNQTNWEALQTGTLNLSSQSGRERYFVSHLRPYPDLAMLQVGLADGSFYGARYNAGGGLETIRCNTETLHAMHLYTAGPQGEGTQLVKILPNYQLTQRPWYQLAAEAGEPVFSDVYTDFAMPDPVITACYPFYGENGTLLGVFGADYRLSWLGGLFESLPVGNQGQVFLVDNAGHLLAASTPGAAYRMVDGHTQLIRAAEGENPIISTALGLGPEQYRGEMGHFRLEGKGYYTQHLAYPRYGTNWTIYVVLAEDDFLGTAKNASQQLMYSLFAYFIFSLIFAFWVSSQVIRPVRGLNAAAKELAKGNFVPISLTDREDELAELGQSFNEMAEQLTDIVANLEQEVALRTRELGERNLTLQKLSFSDGLTGIANRRLFDEVLQQTWAAGLAENFTISLLMMDIDFFKYYNDTYGHLAGDDCLRAIGVILGRVPLGPGELAARYGGEEFVILLRDRSEGSLSALAEEIRRSIEELGLPHQASPFQSVTVSIGGARLLPSTSTAPMTLVEHSDNALYQAKAGGRNRVCIVYTEPPQTTEMGE